MLGSITVPTLISSLFALPVAGPSDTTNVAPLIVENGSRLCEASLFSSYVGDYLVQVFKFATSRTGENSGSDVLVMHAFQENLEDYWVSVWNFCSTSNLGAHHVHITEVCSASDPCNISPDSFICKLLHPPHVHHVDGLVNDLDL